jgi:hypothetical protein
MEWFCNDAALGTSKQIEKTLKMARAPTGTLNLILGEYVSIHWLNCRLTLTSCIKVKLAAAVTTAMAMLKASSNAPVASTSTSISTAFTASTTSPSILTDFSIVTAPLSTITTHGTLPNGLPIMNVADEDNDVNKVGNYNDPKFTTSLLQVVARATCHPDDQSSNEDSIHNLVDDQALIEPMVNETGTTITDDFDDTGKTDVIALEIMQIHQTMIESIIDHIVEEDLVDTYKVHALYSSYSSPLIAAVIEFQRPMGVSYLLPTFL